MLSKCANPECSEQFRYLHQGRLFCLTPTPEVQAASYGALELLYERFWLCDRCSKVMKVVWNGVQAKVVSLPPPAPVEDLVETVTGYRQHVTRHLPSPEDAGSACQESAVEVVQAIDEKAENTNGFFRSTRIVTDFSGSETNRPK